MNGGGGGVNDCVSGSCLEAPSGSRAKPCGGGGQWAKIPEILKSNKIRSAYILMFY